MWTCTGPAQDQPKSNQRAVGAPSTEDLQTVDGCQGRENYPSLGYGHWLTVHTPVGSCTPMCIQATLMELSGIFLKTNKDMTLGIGASANPERNSKRKRKKKIQVCCIYAQESQRITKISIKINNWFIHNLSNLEIVFKLQLEEQIFLN